MENIIRVKPLQWGADNKSVRAEGFNHIYVITLTKEGCLLSIQGEDSDRLTATSTNEARGIANRHNAEQVMSELQRMK